jgi:hypothetical protein
LISLAKKFLFIHIPKTAGNSLQNILSQYSEEEVVSIAPYQDGIERFELRSTKYEIRKHSSLADYKNQLGDSFIDQLFKFTCVRNPWERMVSYYFSPHRGVVEWNREQFVRLLDKVLPAYSYIKDLESDVENSDFSNMDFYMRFENLDADFETACNRIGIPNEKIPVRNASDSQHYSHYYDEELIELVANRFSRDIDYFGYQFGS